MHFICNRWGSLGGSFAGKVSYVKSPERLWGGWILAARGLQCWILGSVRVCVYVRVCVCLRVLVHVCAHACALSVSVPYVRVIMCACVCVSRLDLRSYRCYAPI